MRDYNKTIKDIVGNQEGLAAKYSANDDLDLETKASGLIEITKPFEGEYIIGINKGNKGNILGVSQLPFSKIQNRTIEKIIKMNEEIALATDSSIVSVEGDDGQLTKLYKSIGYIFNEYGTFGKRELKQ